MEPAVYVNHVVHLRQGFKAGYTHTHTSIVNILGFTLYKKLLMSKMNSSSDDTDAAGTSNIYLSGFLGYLPELLLKQMNWILTAF